MKRTREMAAALAVLAVLWWAASIYVVKSLHIPILPSPGTVFYTFLTLWTKGLGLHILYSLYRMGAGIVVAWLLAGAIGIGMGRNKIIDGLVSPAAYLLYPIPKIAFLPIIMLFLGMGDGSKIFIIALIIFFQILIATRDKVKEIRREDLYSIQSLGAKGWNVYRHVILPASLPGIFSALRVSLGTALAVLFIAEYAGGTHWGIGYLIMDAFSRIDYPEMYAAILGLAALGYLLFWLVDVLERIFCPWNTPIKK